jgi:hypothetical protein
MPVPSAIHGRHRWLAQQCRTLATHSLPFPCSLGHIGSVARDVAKHLEANDLVLSRLYIALATDAPRNAALSQPVRKLLQLRRIASAQFKMADMPVRLRDSIWELSAVASPDVVSLVYEPATMPKLATEEGSDPLQDQLPLSVAD